MVANLSGTAVGQDWHTFVYSVDASDPEVKTAKTVTSFDGSATTQFPNYASWFNQNADVNDIQFLNIGGTSGALANSNNNANFVGRIAFVAFLPEVFTQAAKPGRPPQCLSIQLKISRSTAPQMQ